MIVVDSSALLAVFFEEPEKQVFQDIIDGDERCVLSAVNAHETARRGAGGTMQIREDERQRMAHWLIKSEPKAWSWRQQVDAGEKGTFWSGVRNHTAKQNLMAMKLGEEAFFYHSNEGKEIVGIVEVVKTFYADPSDASGKFGMVDFRAVRPLKKPVGLEAIKADARFKTMMLVNNSRLSVQPVSEAEWKAICKMGGVS